MCTIVSHLLTNQNEAVAGNCGASKWCDSDAAEDESRCHRVVFRLRMVLFVEDVDHITTEARQLRISPRHVQHRAKVNIIC